jgi:hypothetical protein
MSQSLRKARLAIEKLESMGRIDQKNFNSRLSKRLSKEKLPLRRKDPKSEPFFLKSLNESLIEAISV